MSVKLYTSPLPTLWESKLEATEAWKRTAEKVSDARSLIKWGAGLAIVSFIASVVLICTTGGVGLIFTVPLFLLGLSMVADGMEKEDKAITELRLLRAGRFSYY